MKRIKLFIPVIAIMLVSCSKNYYPEKLLDDLKMRIQIQEQRMSMQLANQEKSIQVADQEVNKFEYKGKSYTLPFRGKIVEVDGRIVKTKIYSTTTVGVNIGGYIIIPWEKISEIIPRDSLATNDDNHQIYSIANGGDKPKIYFGTNEIERPYDIICYHKWNFIAFPFSQEVTLRHRCIDHHLNNCISVDGDAVIIEPNLINSIVIKYRK